MLEGNRNVNYSRICNFCASDAANISLEEREKVEKLLIKVTMACPLM